MIEEFKNAISVESVAVYGLRREDLQEVAREYVKGTTFIYYLDPEGRPWYWSSVGADIDARIAEKKQIAARNYKRKKAQERYWNKAKG